VTTSKSNLRRIKERYEQIISGLKCCEPILAILALLGVFARTMHGFEMDEVQEEVSRKGAKNRQERKGCDHNDHDRDSS
jgi:hypothetical protein